ncbi:MAG TPA: hypothetical protein VF771_02860 [Longimicrobiaceae bacterium]
MARRRRTPLGLLVIGTVAGVAAVPMALIAVTLAPGTGTIVSRAAAALLAVLSLVAAEALLRVRPWFHRASQALALAWCAVIMVACDGVGGVLPSLVVLMLTAMVLLPLLEYVGYEWRSTVGPQTRAPRRPLP